MPERIAYDVHVRSVISTVHDLLQAIALQVACEMVDVRCEMVLMGYVGYVRCVRYVRYVRCVRYVRYVRYVQYVRYVRYVGYVGYVVDG